MIEIFRMQLGQILGGKMKWLVVFCLALPVLLTLAAVSAGGFGEIKREIEAEQTRQSLRAGVIPSSYRRVLWKGEDQKYANGHLTLTKDGILYGGSLPTKRNVLRINDGYLIVMDGKLWIDPSKKDLRKRVHIHVIRRRENSYYREPEVVITLRAVCAIYLFLLYPQAICLLLALSYGTSLLGHELDRKTLTYLFTRPLPRWKFVFGKYLGIVTALILPTSLSLLASWLILGAQGGLSLIIGVLAGTVGALLAYNALFALFGFLIPRRAIIVALLYGIIFELILSFIPALVNQFTITYYLRSLVVEILELEVPREASRIVGGVSFSFALFALFAIILGSLAASCILAARKEYVVKDEA